MDLFSPAKINLGLRILYKRELDGYHALESIFIKIHWGDYFQIEENISDLPLDVHVEFKISESKKKILAPSFSKEGFQQNLIYRAWNMTRKINPSIPRLKIHLTKNIPPGGGLGGGSSNAATILLYLFQKNYVSFNQIQEIAPKLGADVPFFLGTNSAWVTGIGEELEPIVLANGLGILAIPNESLSTPLMYSKLNLPLQKPQPSKRWKSQEGRLLSSLEKGDWKYLRGLLVNDFERIAYKQYPDLQKIRDVFYDLGSEYSSLTGSGSSIYGIVRSLAEQEFVLSQMKSKFPQLELFTFSF
jgi:4-diphosphocytidyl-2-C-methyl-D-erythritol kinase